MLVSHSHALDSLLNLQKSLEQAMNRDVFGLETTGRGTYPPVSIFRDEESVYVSAELPGVRKEDIQLEIKTDLLRLSGERRRDFAVNEVSVHRHERTFGKFDRTIKLPFVVDSDKAKAEFVDGILNLQLPLAQSHKPRKISIS